MHMHTYQIKQNVVLLGTNFESYNVILFGTDGGFILSQKGMIFFKKKILDTMYGRMQLRFVKKLY
jgi:hypothetical protein